MKVKIMADGWASFERACIPAGASATQRSAMKTAFYGGAAVLLHSVMQGLSPGEDATDPDLSMIESIDRELREFASAGMPRPPRPN